jgi:LPXTG-motif cell wall-anchored protein
MLSRILRATCLCAFAMIFILPAPALAATPGASYQHLALADFPTVDPDYIYDQLFYVATHFQRREAGYDNNLPVTVNGHDEFAAYWSQELMHDLQGFGPQLRHDTFPVQGWQGRPAPVPAFNVEVSVPGALHPEQVVVIGCHYDGEAVSTQSANDDASGCAIELGVARAMGTYWRSHHLYPARTLRFVIFDAEEQGLYGSFHYLNSTINGDTHNIVAMFNEEQNGIAYPLRFLGKTANPLLPFYVDMSPLTNSGLYPAQSKLSPAQRDNITHFRALMQQAVPAAFAQFQAIGFQALTYRNDSNQAVSQPIFTPDQESNIHLENDTLGGSDQIPFTRAGLPCATFVGNTTYYDSKPPPWSYPFDQPQDTIQLMNTFASGNSQKAEALVLALALPGMLTTWMLHQPAILGDIPVAAQAVGSAPVAAISDVGQTQVGQNISLYAEGNNNSNDLTYSWKFGDGATASGASVNHVYAAAGNYTLSLTVSSPRGSRHISKLINVVTKPTSYANPYAGNAGDGNPPRNPAVILPTPEGNQASKTTTTPSSPQPSRSAEATGLPIGAIVFALAALLLVGLIALLVRRKRQV